MRRKLVVVVVLVLCCLGVLAVEGVSQPVPPQSSAPVSPFDSKPLSSPATPSPLTVAAPEPNPNSSAVQPQQGWTFEQLVEALKGVRARQKELQTQEADLLAKLAQKVEEKRQDLSKSEATFQQLRGENGRTFPGKRFEESKMEDRKK